MKTAKKWPLLLAFNLTENTGAPARRVATCAAEIGEPEFRRQLGARWTRDSWIEKRSLTVTDQFRFLRGIL